MLFFIGGGGGRVYSLPSVGNKRARYATDFNRLKTMKFRENKFSYIFVL